METTGTTEAVARRYTGVVMLNRSPLDKIATKRVLEILNGAPLETVLFHNHPVCSEEQMKKWDDRGILTVDLGENKYHSQTGEMCAGSATEFVVKLCGVDLVEKPELAELVKIMNKNNRTGYLRGFHMSIAWTLRELYKLPQYDHREIVERAGEIVSAFLNSTKTSSVDWRLEDEEMEAELEDLCKKTWKCNYAPFTTGRYLRDLWRSGVSKEVIHERVGFWLDGWDNIQAALRNAEKRFLEMDHRSQEFSIGNLRGFWLETDDEFITKPASRAYDVLLVKRPATGQMAFMTNRMNLSDLGAELRRREPDRYWFNDNRQGVLMNGGVIYTGVAGTELTISEAVELLRKYPPK